MSSKLIEMSEDVEIIENVNQVVDISDESLLVEMPSNALVSSPYNDCGNNNLNHCSNETLIVTTNDAEKNILDQIHKRVYNLCRRKGRSLVWSLLCEIIKDNGHILEGYLYCSNCSQLLKYCPKQASNLSRHKCCQILKERNNLKKVTAEDNDAAVDTCVAWITEDCQPFSVISGSGFVKFAKFLVRIGSKYGENVDILDLLPDATTLYRATQKLATDKKREIKDEVVEIVQTGGASATIDLWKDYCVHRHFLGVTLHYQKNMKFYDIVLGIKSMDFERSTSVDVNAKLKTLFNEFGIKNTNEIKFVTDRGSNVVVKALEQNIRLNCSSHLFKNVLQQSFNETSELKDVLQSCKKIVKYVKKANLQHQLSTSLKNECATQWYSNFYMFKSIVDNWFQIKRILNEKEESQILARLCISTLTDLVDLYSNFEVIFKKLQCCRSSSLCFVIPSIQKVRSLCLAKDTDEAAILLLKANIVNNVNKIWVTNLSLWQKTAFFLYPPAVNMQQNDLNDIKKFCISQIDDLREFSSISPPIHRIKSPSPSLCSSDSDSQLSSSENRFLTGPNPESVNQSQFKKDFQFFFPDLLKKPTNSTIKTPSEEIERYCKEHVEITYDFDVLNWWKLNEKMYPLLSKFALQIHSIPASNAGAERAFSVAGNVITEKRNGLWPKCADSILFLHSYFKIYEN